MTAEIDRIFGESGRKALVDACYEAMSYTPLGGGATSISGAKYDLNREIAGFDVVESDKQDATLQVLVSEVPTVTPERDTVEIDGATWRVMAIIGEGGGIWELRIQRHINPVVRGVGRIGR
jgi:hypothetical protein